MKDQKIIDEIYVHDDKNYIDYTPEIFGFSPVYKTTHCPNCGKLCRMDECRYGSTVKMSWGWSTLYGVCAECAHAHSVSGECRRIQ